MDIDFIPLKQFVFTAVLSCITALALFCFWKKKFKCVIQQDINKKQDLTLPGRILNTKEPLNSIVI